MDSIVGHVQRVVDTVLQFWMIARKPNSCSLSQVMATSVLNHPTVESVYAIYKAGGRVNSSWVDHQLRFVLICQEPDGREV